MSICLDLGGVPVGFTHGHLAGKGSLPQAKQKEWWKDQFWSTTPASRAQILVTSHFHHLTVSNWGGAHLHPVPGLRRGKPLVRSNVGHE